MNLKKGLVVHCNGLDISSQLLINSGVVLADHYNQGVVISEDDMAYVPKQDWRKLTATELKIISPSGEKLSRNNFIGLGNLPSHIKSLFEQLELNKCTELKEVVPKFEANKHLTMEVSASMNEFLETFSPTKDFRFHVISRGFPNVETITRRSINGKVIRTGLHMDYSRSFSIHTAHKSNNRISVNLSNEPRSLIFINLSLIQMLNMLRNIAELKDIKIDPINLPRLFFSYYPNYPVIRVIQKPYQYYIAPTDNFLHDGSTLGNQHIDITLVYIGKFDTPKAVSSLII